MPESRRCYLGLGSNLGNRLANLQDALRRMAPNVRIDAVSSLYESEAVGPAGQPPYLNAVAAADTDLEPVPLLRLVKRVEWAIGRRPGARWGPRPADIDILAVDGTTIDLPDLTIPHPRLEERPFVLVPLADVAPNLVLRSGRAAQDVANSADHEGLTRVAGREWLDATAVFPPTLRV